MKSFVLPAILALALRAPAAPPDQGQLDGSLSLFTVLSAIEAAGYSADNSSPNNSPLRRQVYEEIQAKNPPSLEALRQFYQAHRKYGAGGDTAELSQYISFALSVDGAPDFKFRQRNVDIPPDVVPIKGLSPLLAQFYREAGIAEMWQKAQPYYDREIDRVNGPIRAAVQLVTAYLRYTPSGLDRSHFQIYVEPLAPPNQVQVRSYGNEFTVVITPSSEPRTFDIRHAYLYYLLDPLSTMQQDTLERKKLIAKEAARAPALDQSFKDDFLLLTTACLIKAIEAKLDRAPQRILADLKQGFVLTPYFSDAITLYEKQDQPMKDYYPDMIAAIDLNKELARLENLDFDKEPPPPEVAHSTPPPQSMPVPLTGVAKTLDEADRLWDARAQGEAQVENAKRLYMQALSETSQPSQHAAAYYGLARIAAFQKDPESAEQLFQKTLGLQPEPLVKAWSLIYLARLALARDDPEDAAKDFQEALKVNGAPETARTAATDGLKLITKQ